MTIRNCSILLDLRVGKGQVFFSLKWINLIQKSSKIYILQISYTILYDSEIVMYQLPTCRYVQPATHGLHSFQDCQEDDLIDLLMKMSCHNVKRLERGMREGLRGGTERNTVIIIQSQN